MLGLMRPMRLMGLIGLMGLMGCSSDDFEEANDGTSGLAMEVRSYISTLQETQRANETHEANEARGVTRAWSAPSGYYLAEEDKIIGINFTQNNKAPLTGYFFKSNGQWRTSVEIKESGTYYLYGYTPHISGLTCDISSTATPGDNSAYSDGAVMTINNLSTATPLDICVVVGAKEGTDAETVTGLASGKFAYMAKPTPNPSETPDPENKNYVFLLFDHLYAAIEFNINVATDYDALRTIKLKEIRLRAIDKEGVTQQKKINATVTLTKKEDGSSPISSIVYSQTGGEDTEGSPIFTSNRGLDLTLTSQPFLGYFMPSNITKLVMTNIYDIYDKKGNRVRENCKAENTLDASLFYLQNEFLRGKKYIINMTVEPTFLYVMSEPDVEFEVKF